MQRTRVLICGATGLIGRNLLERFAARDDFSVTATYFDSEPDSAMHALTTVAFVRADLTNRADVESVISGQDVVLQAAAVTSGARDIVTRPYLHVTDNAVMNSLIFRACYEHRVKHLIFFSCTTMYPNRAKPVAEDDFDYQIVPQYFGVGWTKVYIEKMCEFYAGISGAKWTAIRHSNIYGPYDKYDLERSHVFGATVTKVMEATDGKIVVWGDGSDARDLLYISDLVDFVEVILARQQSPFELVNVGYGSSIPIRDLVQKLIEQSGKQIAIEFDRSKPSVNFSLQLNISRAVTEYGWKPKVSLDEGIRGTLAWYRDNIAAQPAAGGVRG